MPLATGTRLGPFEVLGKLGEGGMGEVYRARDTRLARDVAIKILAAPFAADADRLARFDREAKALAALNHPHIAQIHGVVELSPGGGDALVMELVEGEDLAQRLARGPLAPRDALPIALQIADALAAAHEQGIVHRDLKPANVTVRGDGTVKVLDFGLAKLVAPEPSGAAVDAMQSPTITNPAFAEASAGQARTALGVILGTAAYMAPEQAKGQPVDRRADVWAFGALLYEMLAGRRAFAGETVSDTMAAILTRDPDWTALPGETPPPVRRLLRRCLEKDRRRRLADMSDARLEIEEALSANAASDRDPQSSAARPAWTWHTALLLAAAAVVAGLAGALVHRALAPSPAAPPVARFFVPLPAGQNFVGQSGGLAISPDGSELVYASFTGLYRRPLGSLDVQRVEGLEALPAVAFEPVYSPDGLWLAFWSARDLTIKKVPAAGGVPATIASADQFAGMSWGEDGILFARGSAIERVSPDGAGTEVLVEAPAGRLAEAPEMLPGGRHVMYTLSDPADPEGSRRVVAQAPGDGEPKTLVTGGGEARYLQSGHLVYAVAGALFVVPFDLDRLEAAGTPVRVVENVRRSFPGRITNFAVSRSGSLAYVPAGTAADAGFELALVNRSGAVDRLALQPGNYAIPRVSPDGGRSVAYAVTDGIREGFISVYDLSGTSAPRRLTFEGQARYPIWSHDGSRVIYHSNRDGDFAVFWQPADGSGPAERLTPAGAGGMIVADAASPDGRHILVQADGALNVLSLADGSLTPFGGVKSVWSIGATFSPDGEWVAYAVKPDLRSDAAVYVQPFPPTGERHQVPFPGEAYHPMWSRDGSELFFSAPPNRLFVTRVSTARGLAFSPPEPLELTSRGGPTSLPRFHDILPDGRLIAVVPAAPAESSAPPAGIHVVLHWTTELGRD
jgi:eukaryotic-like serine/threonine-protein kinase